MCRCPTMTAYRSQKVEAVRGGTGRPGEPGEEFRPTDPRGLQSGHRGMGSVLLTGGQRVRGGGGADVMSLVLLASRLCMLGKLCAKRDGLLHFPFLVTVPAAQLQIEVRLQARPASSLLCPSCPIHPNKAGMTNKPPVAWPI